MSKKISAFALMLAVAAMLVPSAANAATSTNLSQVINAGTLTYDIVDGSGATVASPAVAFPATTFDFTCQTQIATFGTATEKVKISNPLLSGVKLDIAGASTWTTGGGSPKTYAYNNAAGSGCTSGQMTVSGGSFLKTNGANNPTYTLPGGAFSGATPVTLLNNTSATAWEGELTGYSLSQKIPAEQADGTYTLALTLSAITQ